MSKAIMPKSVFGSGIFSAAIISCDFIQPILPYAAEDQINPRNGRLAPDLTNE